MVVSVAPLGLIGVVVAMLPTERPWASWRSWESGADRHPHPQLGDPGHPDRRARQKG